MERPELAVELRTQTGKGVARRLRVGGDVPGVVYGHGCDATPVTVNARALSRLVAGNKIISLTGPSELSGKLVLVKSAQVDPVSRALLHCDLYAVDPSQKIEVSVPLHFAGKPKGVELGGVLEELLRSIEVRCLPLSIPTGFTIDVGEMEIGDVLHARSLPLPEGVELETDPEAPLAHVLAPRVDAGAEEESAEPAAAAS